MFFTVRRRNRRPKQATPAGPDVAREPVRPLRAGDMQYQAYVGPPHQYDVMGATQFALLCSLGLRSTHSLLDLGCGSLRAGRLFLSYLEKGNYCGIEPNRWLIDEAIEQQIGRDMLRLKAPRFDHNARFDCTVFDQKFDFLVAQSIFSHTGPDQLALGLQGLASAVAPSGLIAITFIQGEEDCPEDGWFYAGQPGNRRVTYRAETIRKLALDFGLSTVMVPWFHPRQQWAVMSLNERALPGTDHLELLDGKSFFHTIPT